MCVCVSVFQPGGQKAKCNAASLRSFPGPALQSHDHSVQPVCVYFGRLEPLKLLSHPAAHYYIQSAEQVWRHAFFRFRWTHKSQAADCVWLIDVHCSKGLCHCSQTTTGIFFIMRLIRVSKILWANIPKCQCCPGHQFRNTEYLSSKTALHY